MEKKYVVAINSASGIQLVIPNRVHYTMEGAEEDIASLLSSPENFYSKFFVLVQYTKS